MSANNKILRWIRLGFGLFMVVVYLGMALLLAINFFDWDSTGVWLVARWAMVVVFAAYGCYRCYRQVTGVDYYRGRDDLYGTYDDKDEPANNDVK